MHLAFKALGDPRRLEIVRLVSVRPRHVGALADALGITQPAISRHVAILERAGLIDVARSGRRTEIVAPPRDPAPYVPVLLAMIAAPDRDPRRGDPGHAASRNDEPAWLHPRSARGRPVRRHPVREDLDVYLL